MSAILVTPDGKYYCQKEVYALNFAVRVLCSLSAAYASADKISSFVSFG